MQQAHAREHADDIAHRPHRLHAARQCRAVRLQHRPGGAAEHAERDQASGRGALPAAFERLLGIEAIARAMQRGDETRHRQTDGSDVVPAGQLLHGAVETTLECTSSVGRGCCGRVEHLTVRVDNRGAQARAAHVDPDRQSLMMTLHSFMPSSAVPPRRWSLLDPNGNRYERRSTNGRRRGVLRHVRVGVDPVGSGRGRLGTWLAATPSGVFGARRGVVDQQLA